MHIRAPVHTRGGVDHQDWAAAGGRGGACPSLTLGGFSVTRMGSPATVQECCLPGLQPASGDPTLPAGVYTVGPWASCPPRVSLGHKGSHPARPWGRGRPVPCLGWAHHHSVWTTAFARTTSTSDVFWPGEPQTLQFGACLSYASLTRVLEAECVEIRM